MNDTPTSGNFITRAIRCLRKPSTRYSLITLLVVGFFAGILAWGGFHTGMDASNTLEFCTGCHEMESTVYQEYKETIHYSNRSGVRAVCSDCHVPRTFMHKIYRKVKASKEVYGHLMGVIDTKEKFEAKRMEMAQHEWDSMKASDSRECRNCHNFANMALTKQKPAAQKKHAEAQKEGKTCIDCHKGIAHLLPKEYVDPDE